MSLYTLSSNTQTILRKFSLASSRSQTMKVAVFKIDKSTYEILQDDDIVTEEIESLEDLEEELPDNAPRYVVLSYPLVLKDGRKVWPFVMLYYLPPNSSQNDRMLYAGATELFKSKANVSKMLEVSEVEDFEEIPNLLQNK